MVDLQESPPKKPVGGAVLVGVVRGRDSALRKGAAPMGVTLDKLDDLRARGLLTSGCSVLDFGPSNLYSASEGGIRQFAASYGATIDDADIRRLSEGSAYGSDGTRNESFAGDLLERVGVTYHSIDIADGYRTAIVDLNTQPLPSSFVGAFDTVLNLGTTEHIFNQLACFRAIHDATKVGGHMVHQLPALGWLDHGYFLYTGRLFFDLAGYNDYELSFFEWSRVEQQEDMFVGLRSYRKNYPVLDAYLERAPADEAQRFIRSVTAPSISANVTFRKKSDRPFMAALEASTSIGAIPDWVGAQYRFQPAAAQPTKISKIRKFLTGG